MSDADAPVEVVCLGPDRLEGVDLADALDAEPLRPRAVDGPTPPKESCDCLLVALGPGGAGLDAVRAAAEARAPVLAAVAPGADGAAAEALAAGANDAAVVDPAQPGLLAHRVEQVAKRRATTERLRETEARFEALANTPSTAVLTVDTESTVRYASAGVEDLFGYAPAELEGAPLARVIPDRLTDAHHGAVADYLETGERTLDWSWVELPARRRDGSEFPVAVSFGERTGEGERLFSAVVRDITDRREREERLDRLATAVEETMDGVAILDAEGTYRYVNRAHAEVYGYDDPAALEGETWRTVYDDDQLARFDETVLPELRETGAWRGEATGLRRDGERFRQSLSLTELDDGGIVCVVRDIEDRARRRRELREERRFVESVLDTLPDAFYVLNTDGSFDRWNSRLETVTGYDGAELSEMFATQLVPEEDREEVATAMMTVFQEQEPQTVRSALVTKQGERIPHEFSGSPLTDADGEVVGLAGIGRDVSEKRFREQRLSVLSRVLRHNVRNRTTVIKGHAQRVAEAVDDRELTEALESVVEAADDLADASATARRAERLVERTDAAQRPVDVVAAVEAGVEAAAELPDLRVETPEREPALALGADPLAAAVEELLDNVAAHVPDPTARVRVTRTDGEVRVRVADDGPGLPDAERRALDRGEETPLTHGTGLGLWLVDWVTSLSGGELRFGESDLGGTAAVLAFPAA